MFGSINITNPKINNYSLNNFKYYAGFNSQFVDKLIKSIKLPQNPLILDPWNGVGTTTTVSSKNMIRSIGLDVNPVMVISSKAYLLSQSDIETINYLRNEINSRIKCRKLNNFNYKLDPLLDWFNPQSVATFRKLNLIINELLISDIESTKIDNYSKLSSYASFFYLVVFEVLKDLTKRFKSSNPTWISKPKSKSKRIRPNESTIIKLFEEKTDSLIRTSLAVTPNKNKQLSKILLANSDNTGISNHSIDLVITSPPYCTRIDYAISTSVELAFLYFGKKEMRRLRNQMIGSTTINESTHEVKSEFGKKTNKFLNAIRKHSSKASATYYFKSHVQYYESIYNSLHHLSNDLLKKNGGLIMVVQDSYYKDIHNNIQDNLTDMLKELGLQLKHRKDYECKKSLSLINNKSKMYRSPKNPIESVLCFKNN